jgi:subtilisin-like proprotein convertase family protein
MKREYKYWPYLMLLVISVVFSAGYLALAQESESGLQAQEQLADVQNSEAAVAHQIAGTPGGSIKSAVINFSKLASEEALRAAPYQEPKVIREPGPVPRRKAVSVENGAALEDQGDEAFRSQPTEPLVPSPTPVASFKALEDNGASIPPDTHGAAGPNHLMVTLNTQVRIQNRAGGIISTVSLDAFWASLGSPSTFDPRVFYDPFNNRWMITSVADGQEATSAVLIGVSQTSNPTGNWKLYKVDADPNNEAWADYPYLGFNKNWIVVTVNMFGIFDGRFKRAQIYAFNKASLYAFSATASHKVFQEPNGGSMSPAQTYDNTLNPLYMIEDWDGHTQLRISLLNGTAASPVYSTTHLFPTVAAGSSWTFFPPNGDDFAPQQGTTRKIQLNDSRIQNVVYRGGSLWCAQTIFLPNSATPTRAAVQWWELAPEGTIRQRGRIDDASAPLTFYAFPSIAVNKNRDVLIGFSRFSSQQYASANYALRTGADPPNTLRLPDVILKAGGAPYDKDFGSGRNRWGDYSSTVVDPLNDVNMWTVQEHAAPVSGGSSRWGTWWGLVKPPTSPPFALLELGAVTARDAGGDPDANIEPGEGGRLTIQLKNLGTGAATAVSGKLTTTTTGVTITTATSGYPNIGAGSSATNTTPFAFNVASSVVCGRVLIFKLTVTYTGGSGSPKVFTFTVPTGKPGTAPVTKARTGSPVKIPDPPAGGSPTTVNIPFAVSGVAGLISDLNFKFGGTSCTTAAGATTVGLDHTWVGDLTIKLKSPAGTIVTLMNSPGGVANSGHNFCNTVLDDDGAGGLSPSIQSVTPSQAPYTGTFSPASPLSAFDGQAANGTWTLIVTDSGHEDTGFVRAFSLIITTYSCSTTALAVPVETQRGDALAGLRDESLRAALMLSRRSYLNLLLARQTDQAY